MAGVGLSQGWRSRLGACTGSRAKQKPSPRRRPHPAVAGSLPDSRFWTFWRFHSLSCALSAVASVKSLNAFTHLIPTRAL